MIDKREFILNCIRRRRGTAVVVEFVDPDTEATEIKEVRHIGGKECNVKFVFGDFETQALFDRVIKSFNL